MRPTSPFDTSFKHTQTANVEKIAGGTAVNQYLIIKTLGTGSYGKVKLCLNTLDSKLYAVKIFNKKMLKRRTLGRKKDSSDPIDGVRHEIAIMKKLLHPNVVNLYEVIDDPDGNEIYMVLEYVDGGVAVPGSNGDPEADVRHTIREVCKGLDYLHFNKVIHRDLKPANLLRCADGTVKIADFGVSKLFMHSDTLTNTAGTPAFLAPEMCCPGPYHGKATDIWALGVCLWNMIFGTVPFKGQTIVQVYESIKKCDLEFPADHLIGDDLRDLMTRMLDKDPATRLTLPEVMTHPWVTDNGREPLPSTGSSRPKQIRATNAEMENAIKRDNIMSLLSPLLAEKTYKPGEYLMRKGEIGTEMFFINSGEVDILVDPNKAENSDDDDEFDSDEDMEGGGGPKEPRLDDLIVVATRDAGQFIGEMAVFEEESRRTAYCRAKTEVKVLVVTAEQAKEVMRNEPDAKSRVARTIAKRKSEVIVEQTKAQLRQHGQTIEAIRERQAVHYVENYQRFSTSEDHLRVSGPQPHTTAEDMMSTESREAALTTQDDSSFDFKRDPHSRLLQSISINGLDGKEL